jgi:hypothetical protein
MAEFPASLPGGSYPALEPGQYVRNPKQPQWGLGQVQSTVGNRVTVNFAHAGKIMVNARVVALVLADPFDSEHNS